METDKQNQDRQKDRRMEGQTDRHFSDTSVHTDGQTQNRHIQRNRYRQVEHRNIGLQTNRRFLYNCHHSFHQTVRKASAEEHPAVNGEIWPEGQIHGRTSRGNETDLEADRQTHIHE